MHNVGRHAKHCKASAGQYLGPDLPADPEGRSLFDPELLLNDENCTWIDALSWSELELFTGGQTVTVPTARRTSFRQAGKICEALWDAGHWDNSLA